MVPHAKAAPGGGSGGRKRKLGMPVLQQLPSSTGQITALPYSLSHLGLSWGLCQEPSSKEKVGGSAGRHTLV